MSRIEIHFSNTSVYFHLLKLFKKKKERDRSTSGNKKFPRTYHRQKRNFSFRFHDFICFFTSLNLHSFFTLLIGKLYGLSESIFFLFQIRYSSHFHRLDFDINRMRQTIHCRPININVDNGNQIYC